MYTYFQPPAFVLPRTTTDQIIALYKLMITCFMITIHIMYIAMIVGKCSHSHGCKKMKKILFIHDCNFDQDQDGKKFTLAVHFGQHYDHDSQA